LIVLCFLIFLFAGQFYGKGESHDADIYALLVFTLIGGIMLASYSNLTMLFIGIETLSISLYILAGSRKRNLGSNEAALKYFLLGSFSTGFLLFGIALIFGITNTFDLGQIRSWLDNYFIAHPDQESLPLIFKAGIFLMLVGLFFKVSAAPFHFWAPDVYTGSPTLITAFMASLGKTAAFAALFRLFYTCFGSVIHDWFIVMWVVCVLTIIVGNLTAVFQKSVKRMLAYSSVSNAGYLLIGVLAMNEHAASAILYYAVAYSIATISAFSILSIVSVQKNSDEYDSFKGLAHNNPLLAAAMIISMLSLAGIPPLAGFFGKYYLFANALENNYKYLVIIAVLGSLIGIYYYFKVIVSIFSTETSSTGVRLSGVEAPTDITERKIPLKIGTIILLVLSVLLLLVLGLFPQILIGIL
jgi:NADH-quinone oxidoreductase subunit N